MAIESGQMYDELQRSQDHQGGDPGTDVGLRLNAYTAEPGSPSQEALNLLASWTAALHAPPVARPAD